jgi:hypothetical protein
VKRGHTTSRAAKKVVSHGREEDEPEGCFFSLPASAIGTTSTQLRTRPVAIGSRLPSCLVNVRPPYLALSRLLVERGETRETRHDGDFFLLLRYRTHLSTGRTREGLTAATQPVVQTRSRASGTRPGVLHHVLTAASLPQAILI